MRLGVLGGGFNPPHIGHLACAQEAFVQLELDTVLFVPFGRAPHRRLEHDPGTRARLEMCELALSGEDRFEASRAELERAGPSYTVDTLAQMRQGAPERELFLILGGDQAASLPSWRAPEEVLRLASVAVAERGGFARERIESAVAGLAGAERMLFFEMPRIEVSSSLVRRRAAEGKPIRYLVPDPVVDYIQTEGLYRTSAAVSAD